MKHSLNIILILFFLLIIIGSLYLEYILPPVFLMRKGVMPKNKKESFSNMNKFEFYVITMGNNPDRLKNIQDQQSKIGESNKIQLFNAVVGDKLDVNKLFESGFLDKEKYKNPTKKNYREFGCYLSHFYLLKSIKKRTGYTIVFEDDFNIVDNKFIENIQNMTSLIHDFDIIFLGNLNKNRGGHIIDNIYHFDKESFMWGTHAYLVNNRNLDKIIETIRHMDDPIDDKYQNSARKNLLNILVIYPTMVDQQDDTLASDIQLDEFGNSVKLDISNWVNNN